MCERLLNLQEIYVSGQNICIEVYGNSVGTITPIGTFCLSTDYHVRRSLYTHHKTANCILAHLCFANLFGLIFVKINEDINVAISLNCVLMLFTNNLNTCSVYFIIIIVLELGKIDMHSWGKKLKLWYH